MLQFSLANCVKPYLQCVCQCFDSDTDSDFNCKRLWLVVVDSQLNACFITARGSDGSIVFIIVAKCFLYQKTITREPLHLAVRNFCEDIYLDNL